MADEDDISRREYAREAIDLFGQLLDALPTYGLVEVSREDAERRENEAKAIIERWYHLDKRRAATLSRQRKESGS